LDIAAYPDPGLLLRLKDLGAGILPSVVAGALLDAVVALAFDRGRCLPMLGASLGLALPLGFVRLREASEIRYACGYECLAEVPRHLLYSLSAPLSLAAAVACAVALWRAGAWALIAVAAFPLIAVVNEIAYLAGEYESPTTRGLLWIMVVPALAVVALAVITAVRAHRLEPTFPR